MLIFEEGFESGEWTHKVDVFPQTAPGYTTDIGNIFTPKGWRFWFRHNPGTFDQPEAHNIWKAAAADRIHTGEAAFMYFGFYRGMHAGLYSQHQAIPGTNYKLTAYAHAWSNGVADAAGGHLDNPGWSDGAGFNHVAWAKALNLPYDTGDTQIDAKPNFTFYVGIDPTGGTNPFSDTVVWGEGYHIYNGYVKQLSVESVAKASTITIFLRAKTLWNFKHNDAYWDSVCIEANTVQPPHPCRGTPRIQYDRTYILMPPTAGTDMAAAAIDATWDNHRYTLGASADDSGIGDLDSKHVIAVNPEYWGDDLETFLNTYYPGCSLETVVASTPQELFVLLHDKTTSYVLSQNDPRWQNSQLGNVATGETIGQQGCLLTNLTMLLRKDAGRDVTPPEINKQLSLAQNVFVADDYLDWDASIKLFPGIYDASTKLNAGYSPETLEQLLLAGNSVILRVFNGNHFVLLDSVDATKIYVIDPWDGMRKEWPAQDICGVRTAHKINTPATKLLLGFNAPELSNAHECGTWLNSAGNKSLLYVPLFIGIGAQRVDFSDLQSVQVIVNLRYSWSVDAGGEGTLPAPDKQAEFIQACIDTIKQSKGVWGWTIGNELNNPREFPKNYVLTPGYFVNLYNFHTNSF